MKESQVLIVGLSNCCTELARHLVLSGVNIKLVAQKSEVQSNDYQSEFLLSPEDEKKSKGEVIIQKLAEMNPFSKIEFGEIDSIESLESLIGDKKFSAVVIGL